MYLDNHDDNWSQYIYEFKSEKFGLLLSLKNFDNVLLRVENWLIQDITCSFNIWYIYKYSSGTRKKNMFEFQIDYIVHIATYLCQVHDE